VGYCVEHPFIGPLKKDHENSKAKGLPIAEGKSDVLIYHLITED
jgi:hypothetical protein